MAEEGDGAVEALTDGDGGATEAVAVALALDLVLAAAVTAGEIAAELSGGMKGEDEVEAHIRRVPVLAVTDSMTSPLARNSSLYFVVRDAEVHRFRPLAAPIVLAQSLIIALGYYRDARLEQAAAGAGKPARARARRRP